MCRILQENGHGGPIGDAANQLHNMGVDVNGNLLTEFNLIVKGL